MHKQGLTAPQSAAGVCQADGILKLFNQSSDSFQAVAQQGRPALLEALSQPAYPDGTPVVQQAIFPGAQRHANGTLIAADLAVWVRVVAEFCAERA